MSLPNQQQLLADVRRLTNLPPPGAECCICFDMFDWIYVTPCQHTMCRPHALKHFTGKANCPICRTVIFDPATLWPSEYERFDVSLNVDERDVISEIHKMVKADEFGELDMKRLEDWEITIDSDRLWPALVAGIHVVRKKTPPEPARRQRGNWARFGFLVGHLIKRKNGIRMSTGALWGIMMVGWMGGLLHNDERLPDYGNSRASDSSFEGHVVDVCDFVVFRALQIERADEAQALELGMSDTNDVFVEDEEQEDPAPVKKAKSLGQQYYKNLSEVWRQWHQ